MKRFVDFSLLAFPPSTITRADWSRRWMIIEQSSSSTDREEWTRLWHTSDWTNTSIAWGKQWIIKEKQSLEGLVKEEQQHRSRAVGDSLIPCCLSHRGKNKKQRLQSTHQERVRENRCSPMTLDRILYLFSRFLSVESGGKEDSLVTSMQQEKRPWRMNGNTTVKEMREKSLCELSERTKSPCPLIWTLGTFENRYQINRFLIRVRARRLTSLNENGVVSSPLLLRRLVWLFRQSLSRSKSKVKLWVSLASIVDLEYEEKKKKPNDFGRFSDATEKWFDSSSRCVDDCLLVLLHSFD